MNIASKHCTPLVEIFANIGLDYDIRCFWHYRYSKVYREGEKPVLSSFNPVTVGADNDYEYHWYLGNQALVKRDVRLFKQL